MEIKALIEAAAQGDQRAWRALTRRIEPKLRRWFASKYGMFDDDLVQDTLIVVWNKLPDFEMRSEAAFKSWVLKIARFVALAMRRERGYEAKAEQAGALAIARRTPSMGLSSRMDRAEHLDLVEREADKLPESLRLAVNNMLTGGDARELADDVGLKWATIRGYESRALDVLRQRLAPPSTTPDS